MSLGCQNELLDAIERVDSITPCLSVTCQQLWHFEPHYLKTEDRRQNRETKLLKIQ